MTLRELVIVVGILGVGGAVCTTAVGRGCSQTESAQQEAQQWMHQMNIKGTVSCMSHDSDGDGYVSCTIKDESGELRGIECASSFAFTRKGCRVPKIQGYRR